MRPLIPYLYLRAIQIRLGSILRWPIILRGLLTGKRPYCYALAGRSNYCVSVNSDLTVSCSCQDKDGAAILGDLKTHSFHEIWTGPVATRFRRAFAQGRIPIHWCVNCPGFGMVEKAQAKDQATKFSMPKLGLMVENNSLCNYACTSCERSVLAKTRTQRSMSRLDMEHVAKSLSPLGLESISFLKDGEPFLSTRILFEIQILKRNNPGVFIYCSTNGTLLNSIPKRWAACEMGAVMFSIDGINTPMVRRYQGNGDFEAAYLGMRGLVEHRQEHQCASPLIIWKYVLFRWNDHAEHIEEALALARTAGVDYLCFTPTLSPPWGVSWRHYLLKRFKGIGTPTVHGIMVKIAATPEQEKVFQKWMVEKFRF